MVAKASPRRGRVLPGCLLALCVCWAFCSALPSVAAAEGPAACPEGSLDASELSQPEKEVRELRNDLRVVCVSLAERLDETASNTKGLGAELATLDSDLVELHKDLTATAGVPVDVVAQKSAVDVAAPGGIEVSNPPDVAAVRSAVEANSETFDSNAWGIAGLFVGLAALAWVWKLVRP